jgi:hypothetical protein
MSETEARDYWARLGHGAGVINFDTTRFAAREISPAKALQGVPRADDHEIQMTSLLILVSLVRIAWAY